MNKMEAFGLLAVKAVFGASLAAGLLLTPAHASAATDDPGIVTDGSGQLRDCTVTDSLGVRADWDKACDTYWAESAGYHDGLRAIVTQL